MEGCGQIAAQARASHGGWPNVLPMLRRRNNRVVAATIVSPYMTLYAGFRARKLKYRKTDRSICNHCVNRHHATPRIRIRPASASCRTGVARFDLPCTFRDSICCNFAHRSSLRDSLLAGPITSILCGRHILRPFPSRDARERRDASLALSTQIRARTTL